MKFIEIIVITIAAIVIAEIWVERKDAHRNLVERLYENWQSARAARERWEKEHFYSPLFFRYMEYQRLWNIEIGAESLYLLKSPNSHIAVSWYEYQQKKTEAEKNRI